MVFYCVVDQMELTAEDAATFNNTTTKAEIVAPQGSRHSGRPSADDHDIENFSFKVHSGKSECTLFVIGFADPMPFFVTAGNCQTSDYRQAIPLKLSFFPPFTRSEGRPRAPALIGTNVALSLVPNLGKFRFARASR